MKTDFYAIAFALAVVCICNNSNAQSNRSLSNLTSPTAINQSLLPNSNNSKDLGSDTLGWRNLYLTSHIYLDKNIVLHVQGSGNIFLGAFAGNTSLPGAYNTANGVYALNKLTTGNNNSASGYGALYSNTTGTDNIANGYTSLYNNTTGSFNTASGSWALNKNITGSQNTAYGYSALWQNQTGNDNTAIGKYAMYSNTKGFSNIALGTMALFRSARNNNTVAIGDSALYNFTGDLFTYESYTTAVGSKALFNATSGYENTAIGTRALFNTTKGSINTAVGVSALYGNTEGVFNTAMGVSALSGNTTGKYNTGIGYSSLQINKTGIQNTALGAYAGPNSFDLVSNSTSIGYLARATASNQVRLGNTEVTSIGGQVGWTTFSDGRYKRNIKENVPGLAFINALKPVTYTVDIRNLHTYLNKDRNRENKVQEDTDELTGKAIDEAGKIIHDGFVAQEVEEAAKKLGFEFSGVDKPKTEDGLYGLRYDNFVVPLVKAVQELSKMNDKKDARIDSLQQHNHELEKRIEKLEAVLFNQSTVNSQQLTVLPTASLEQNTPNPFTHSTTIHYTLPQKFSAAQIVISDNAGKVLKQLHISGAGKGTLNVNTSMLTSGTYNYSLIIDGKLIATKQMMTAK
jgi:hypothetical protein